uniref:Ig-like domain-containing protein n=1 Tax=Syphacia muris TaxID=451379 RepID=A0A0N5AV45_9BILA
MAHLYRFYNGQQLERVLYFTDVSKNNSYREGSTIRLVCKAVMVIYEVTAEVTKYFWEPVSKTRLITAKLSPRTQWYHKGKEIFETKKFKYQENSTILSIYLFTRADTGTYQYVAKNKHGQQQRNISVELLKTAVPQIVDAPESKTVQPGQQVTFFYRATAFQI